MRELRDDEILAVAGGVCGSGWLEMFIPDKPFRFDFTYACMRHDTFYQDPRGMSREDIDKQFLADMLNVVGDSALGKITAYAYYGAVRLAGGLYFEGSGTPTTADAQDIRTGIQRSIAYDVWSGAGGSGMQLVAAAEYSGSTFEQEVAAWWKMIEGRAQEQLIVS